MTNQFLKPIKGTPTWLLALLALVDHGSSHAALPPAATTSPQSVLSPVAGADVKDVEGTGLSWSLPPIQIGGSLQYRLRREDFDDRQSSQNGLTATVSARTATYIWQPWFAGISGNVAFTSSTNSANSSGSFIDNQLNSANSNRSVQVTGSAELSVLPFSKFPFEAYFQQNDSRMSSDLAIANAQVGRRFGFRQRYIRPEGDANLSWERNTNSNTYTNGNESGSDQQDSLQLRMTHRMDRLSMAFNTDHNTNNRGESITQIDLSLNDNYQPTPALTVQSNANLSNGVYSLVQGGTTTRVLQLGSIAFWRPEEKPFTVNGGVRLFALGVDGSGQGNPSDSFQVRSQNLNMNAGISYKLNQFTSINVDGNVNISDSDSDKSTTTSQTAAIVYQPDSIDVGNFRYNWGTSASASNQTGKEEAQQQLSLQFTQSLGRSITLSERSSISMDVNQSLSASASTNDRASISGAGTKRVTHIASVSLNTSGDSTSSLLRLSLSDSRALDGDRDFFQLVNFQASSNMPTSSYSSWAGSITIQAVRQSSSRNAGTSELSDPQNQNEGFMTTSSGAITYQNQRMFGIRQLRFTSDLRLNGDSVLPVFGDSQDQEAAAWENQFSYFIGRTQLRLNLSLAKTTSPKTTIDPVTRVEVVEGVKKTNKSIVFTMQRDFGAF